MWASTMTAKLQFMSHQPGFGYSLCGYCRNSLWLLLELYSVLSKLRVYLGSVVDLSSQGSDGKPGNYCHK